MEDIGEKKDKEICGVYRVLVFVKRKVFVLSIVLKLKYEVSYGFEVQLYDLWDVRKQRKELVFGA